MLCIIIGSVTLEVLTSEVNITESDDGEEIVVRTCFRANLPQPLNREVIFGLIESNSSTSTRGAEYYPNITIPDIIIPRGFRGEFRECIDIVVIGDNLVEDDEIIVYDVVSLSGRRDVVAYPQNMDSIVINVSDNDGE